MSEEELDLLVDQWLEETELPSEAGHAPELPRLSEEAAAQPSNTEEPASPSPEEKPASVGSVPGWRADPLIPVLLGVAALELVAIAVTVAWWAGWIG